MYYTSFHFYRIKKDSAPAFGMKTSSNTLKKKLKLVANSAGAVSILFTVRFMSFHLGNNNFLDWQPNYSTVMVLF